MLREIFLRDDFDDLLGGDGADHARGWVELDVVAEAGLELLEMGVNLSCLFCVESVMLAQTWFGLDEVEDLGFALRLFLQEQSGDGQHDQLGGLHDLSLLPVERML